MHLSSAPVDSHFPFESFGEAIGLLGSTAVHSCSLTLLGLLFHNRIKPTQH